MLQGVLHITMDHTIIEKNIPCRNYLFKLFITVPGLLRAVRVKIAYVCVLRTMKAKIFCLESKIYADLYNKRLKKRGFNFSPQVLTISSPGNIADYQSILWIDDSLMFECLFCF